MLSNASFETSDEQERGNYSEARLAYGSSGLGIDAVVLDAPDLPVRCPQGRIAEAAGAAPSASMLMELADDGGLDAVEGSVASFDVSDADRPSVPDFDQERHGPSLVWIDDPAAPHDPGNTRGDGENNEVEHPTESNPDDRERLRAEHLAAFRPFAPGFARARTIHAAGNYRSHSGYVGQGGPSESPGSGDAVFRVEDPSGVGPCVVGFSANPRSARVSNRVRYEALLRAAFIEPDQRDRVEQVVALDPVTETPIRREVPGRRAIDLPEANKQQIGVSELHAVAHSIGALMRCGVAPDGGYARNTLIDEHGTTRLVDNVPVDEAPDEDRAQRSQAQALLGIAGALCVPRRDEQGRMSAWLEGARIFADALQVCDDRYTGISRNKDHIELRQQIGPAGLAIEEDHARGANLPFFQRAFRGHDTFPESRAQAARTQHAFNQFVDDVRERYEFRDDPAEAGLRYREVQTRDGGQATIWLRETPEGAVVNQWIVIEHAGQITRYEFYDSPPRTNGVVIRSEQPRLGLSPQVQAVDMQELAGLIYHLDIDLDYTHMNIADPPAGQPLYGADRAAYYAPISPDGLSYVQRSKQRWDVSTSIPVSGLPGVRGEGVYALCLPHGCTLNYTVGSASLGQQGVVWIRSAFVPGYLRSYDANGRSVEERLLLTLRDRCILAGIGQVNGVISHAAELASFFKIFGEGAVTMFDAQWGVIPTREAATACLDANNILMSVTLAGSNERSLRLGRLLKRDSYYEATPDDYISDATTTQEIQDIRMSTPLRGMPADEESSNTALCLPHGCVLEYSVKPLVVGRPRIADVQWLSVPKHLRHQQQLGEVSIGQRLVTAFRDECIAQGIDEIRASDVTHPGSLTDFVRTFGESKVTMLDAEHNPLTLEEGINYLVGDGHERSVMVRAILTDDR